MTRRDMAYLDRPLIVLPDGTLIRESQVRRFGRTVRIVVEAVAFAVILLGLLFITTWMGPA